MYKHKKNIRRTKTLLRYGLIFNCLVCLLVFSFTLSINGYATNETAHTSESSLNVSAMTKITELNEAKKVTIDICETNYTIPSLLLVLGFVIFVTFTFIFPTSCNIKMLNRLK